MHSAFRFFNMMKNGHGDVTALVSGGAVTNAYDYDAYGVEKNLDSADTNPFRYCGEYFDQETQNIYLRNRYYNPSNGRFITEDPAQDGLNWYVYCGNNPLKYVDPTGTVKEEDTKYGTDTKVYMALVILGEAWEAFPEYQLAIEELANEVRWIGDQWGSDAIEDRIYWGLTSGAMKSLSTVEQVISAAYVNQALVMNDARNRADKITLERYSQEGNGTDAANAFKHIYWSAYASSKMGTKYTRIFTNAHEFGWYEENLNDPEAMKMDLHNNQRGRILSQQYPRDRLIEAVSNDIASGNAAVIKNGRSVLTTPEWRARW